MGAGLSYPVGDTMGTRASAKTIATIIVAFLEETTWTQKALAERCGISVKALRPHLLALRDERVLPLESELELPHVTWSVPNGAFPAAATLARADVATIVRLIARHPRSAERERMLGRLLRFTHEPALRSDRVAPPDGIVSALESAAIDRRALRIRYHSAHRGEIIEEVVSVQTVEHGDRLRFVARRPSGELRWYRANGVERATLTGDDYVGAEGERLEIFLASSVDGFHSGGAPVPYEFVVRLPEARWVARNLPPPLRMASVNGGALIRGECAALPVVAAYVVGLGDAATALSEELRREVVRLARGALRANERALRKGDGRAVGSKRVSVSR